MNKKEETVRTYNKGASEFAKYFDGIDSRTKDIERGFSYLENQPRKTLELGCGNGRDAKDILEYTDDYLGIDISEGMISLARESVPEGNFLTADMEDFTFPPHLNIIFAFASLLHVNKEAVKNILRKAHNDLDQDGIFYISLKYDDYQEKIKDGEFGRRYFYFYNEQDMSELSQETGYEIVYEDKQLIGKTDWITCVLKRV